MKPSRSVHGEGFDEPAFLGRLREGDPAAYRQLIRRMHEPMVGVASSIIGSRAQAEEVVQETWLAVFSGIGRFEGRSSLTTWLFSIVTNRARTRISQECRTVALPAVLDEAPAGARTDSPAAFTPAGGWITAPHLFDELDPERIVGERQLWAHVLDVINALPHGQRAVVILRDQEGKESGEVCELLSISPENQRVLLHRARLRIREAVDALVSHSSIVKKTVRPHGAGQTVCGASGTPGRCWPVSTFGLPARPAPAGIDVR
jgi:RNA polymerase sigma-70 factor (ECF subfamily)